MLEANLNKNQPTDPPFFFNLNFFPHVHCCKKFYLKIIVRNCFFYYKSLYFVLLKPQTIYRCRDLSKFLACFFSNLSILVADTFCCFEIVCYEKFAFSQLIVNMRENKQTILCLSRKKYSFTHTTTNSLSYFICDFNTSSIIVLPSCKNFNSFSNEAVKFLKIGFPTEKIYATNIGYDFIF